MLKLQIKEHRCYPDTGPMLIYDVYSGDDPRDYARPGYSPMVRIKSFSTKAAAEAYCANQTWSGQ